MSQPSKVRTVPAVIGAVVLAALAGLLVWLVAANPEGLGRVDKEAGMLLLMGAGLLALGSFVLFMAAATGEEPG